jgi:hypothetical protein
MGGAAVGGSSEPVGPFILRHQRAAIGYSTFFVLGAVLYGCAYSAAAFHYANDSI